MCIRRVETVAGGAPVVEADGRREPVGNHRCRCGDNTLALNGNAATGDSRFQRQGRTGGGQRLIQPENCSAGI